MSVAGRPLLKSAGEMVARSIVVLMLAVCHCGEHRPAVDQGAI